MPWEKDLPMIIKVGLLGKPFLLDCRDHLNRWTFTWQIWPPSSEDFVQGLRSDVQETVLLKQPQTFREAQEMARLACDVKATMNNFPQDSFSTQVTNLTQTMNSLLLPSALKAKQGVPSEDKQLMAMMEQNNAILAELSASIW